MSSEQDKDAARRQAIRAQIDENLKRVYARTAAEELPDRFKDLLAQLKAKESTGSDGGGSDEASSDGAGTNRAGGAR